MPVKNDTATEPRQCPQPVEARSQAPVQDHVLAQADAIHDTPKGLSNKKPEIKITIPETYAVCAATKSPIVTHDTADGQSGDIRHASPSKAGLRIRSAQRPDSMTHSPLSSMAMTAQRMSADLDESAESMHRNSVHKLNNRFSVSNFLHLASSVLTKSNKTSEDGSDNNEVPSSGLMPSAHEKLSTVIQQNEICTVTKSPRPRSSSFMTVVATPVQPENEILENTTESPTLRVMTSQQLVSGHTHDIPEVKTLLQV